MGSQPESWLRSAAAAGTPAVLLAEEGIAGRGARFGELDSLTAQIVGRMLGGERIAQLGGVREAPTVQLLPVTLAQRRDLEESFAVERQQARGAWFLPEHVSLRIGLANLPHHFRRQPRFAMTAVTDEGARVRLAGSPDAVFLWAVLEPLCEALFRPFQLRGPQAGTKDRAWQVREWAQVEQTLEPLGIEGDALGRMRFGGGWSQLRAHEQVAVRQHLLGALARVPPETLCAKFRAARLLSLLGRYADKAKKGPPTKQQVLTKEHQRTLAAYFGGDWLALLDYLGESPHPDERITTALPTPRLYATDHDRVAEIAADQGVPTAEVERILAAFWGEETPAASPVALRTAALRDYWQHLDGLHARQASGMRTLWGLVEDGLDVLADTENPTQPYQPGLYRRLLPPPLVSQIDELWGRMLLPRWPQRIVSTPLPHGLLADAFGPALKFWHGCGLTAWFLCEGPMSRTDLAELPTYYRAELAALAQAGCPVDEALFRELLQAESRLGDWEPILDERKTAAQRGETGLMFTFFSGRRRAGFALLRDIITRHRRAWAARYLDSYLEYRWRTTVEGASRQYNVLLENRGKAPTLRQFAPQAAAATNHWLGGNISALYRMIGEKSPTEPQVELLMPDDRHAFAARVFAALEAASIAPIAVANVGGSPRDDTDRGQAQWALRRLASASLRAVQLHEALGRPPTLDEFGRSDLERATPLLADTVEGGWLRYQAAIAAALPVEAIKGSAESARRDSQLPSQRTNTLSPASAPLPNGSPEASARPLPFWKRLFGRDRLR